MELPKPHVKTSCVRSVHKTRAYGKGRAKRVAAFGNHTIATRAARFPHSEEAMARAYDRAAILKYRRCAPPAVSVRLCVQAPKSGRLCGGPLA